MSLLFEGNYVSSEMRHNSCGAVWFRTNNTQKLTTVRRDGKTQKRREGKEAREGLWGQGRVEWEEQPNQICPRVPKYRVTPSTFIGIFAG